MSYLAASCSGSPQKATGKISILRRWSRLSLFPRRRVCKQTASESEKGELLARTSQRSYIQLVGQRENWLSLKEGPAWSTSRGRP